MLALVVVELAPQTYTRDTLPTALAGTVAGAALMLILAAVRCRGLLRGDGRSTSGSFEMTLLGALPVGRLAWTFEAG